MFVGVMGHIAFKRCLVDPAEIPSSNVIPSFFNLIVCAPHELTADVGIVGFKSASSQLLGLSWREMVGIGPALAIFDDSSVVDVLLDIWIDIIAVWTMSIGSSIEVNIEWSWEIRFWAFNLAATKLGLRTGVIESLEPVSAIVDSEGPFTKPNFHFELLCLLGLFPVFSAEIVDRVIIMGSVKGIIVVMVQNNFVIILEEVVPNACFESEGVMEDKSSIRCHLLHHFSDISVEILQWFKWSIPPWFIHGLEGSESWMLSVSFKEVSGYVLRSLYVVVVDTLVVSLVIGSNFVLDFPVPLTNPISCGVSLLGVVGFIWPEDKGGHTAIVEAVLGTFSGVDIEKDLDAILVSRVHKPVDLFSSPILTAYIWSILIKSPVTNR